MENLFKPLAEAAKQAARNVELALSGPARRRETAAAEIKTLTRQIRRLGPPRIVSDEEIQRDALKAHLWLKATALTDDEIQAAVRHYFRCKETTR